MFYTNACSLSNRRAKRRPGKPRQPARTRSELARADDDGGRKDRSASVHAAQFGLPVERIVARPILRASIFHSRKPGSTKYSTGVSSTAFVLARGSLQRQ